MTTKGLLTLVTGLLIAATGRIFGIIELLVSGLAIAALVLISLVSVLAPRGKLQARRQLRPPRITEGQPAHVDISLTQFGRLSSGLIEIVDQVSNTEGARLSSTPVEGDRSRSATYRIRPPSRGVVEIGPLKVQRFDTLGFAKRTVSKLGTSDLIVHPHIVPVSPPPRPRAVDLSATMASAIIDLKGEDFHALRPYELGDDLRRVHWKATARHDELMIREHDDTREGRTTVVADCRQATVSPTAFERIMVATASILHAATNRGDEVAVVFTDGTVPLTATDKRSLIPILDALARATLVREPRSLSATTQALRSGQRAGTLVTLLGDGDVDESARDLAVGFQDHIGLKFAFRDDHHDSVTTDFQERWASAIASRTRRVKA